MGAIEGARRMAAIGASLSALAACAGGDPAALPPSGAALLRAHAVPMAAGPLAVPPAGLLGFCARHLRDCAAGGGNAVVVALDPRRRDELEAVQARVNAAVAPGKLPNDAWDYPIDGHGECNQYALEKRRELMALGWPREALLLTAALTEAGEGHLVLVARTSAGDLVLDNRAGAVVDWTYLPYRWLVQQNAASLSLWMSLEAPPTALPPLKVG